MTISYILYTILIICVSVSTTDSKAGEEKKPSTIRTSAGTELTPATPAVLDISNFE